MINMRKRDQPQQTSVPQPMSTMTLSEFRELEKHDPYYEGRWKYFKKVIGIINRESFKCVLELGPYKQPIVHGSDIMDIRADFTNLTYEHDATNIPWPIEDKKYDLFIALQVWEHLENKKQDAFNEVMRISKMAILSFPLNWNCPGDCHHGITKKDIAEWTLNTVPAKKIKVRVGSFLKKKTHGIESYIFSSSTINKQISTHLRK